MQVHGTLPLMRYLLLLACIGVIGLGLPSGVAAAPTLTYMYQHHLFSIDVAREPAWKQPRRTWKYRGVVATPPDRLLGSVDNPEDPDWTWIDRAGWNDAAIAETIAHRIGKVFDREAGRVVIRRSATGGIVFDGYGLPGRSVDIDVAVRLTRHALDSGISVIALPVTETQPAVTVEDPELRSLGIREVVTVGESIFAGSPANRRHNIAVGVARFLGHLVPRGATFSFVETLGPVNAATGYRKELVIQGTETLPDYGGGLCQVSTTAYRGVWEYGLPIVQRKNHSYAVSYYGPQGTDATIYPPAVDMKFINDTPGALLIQSFTDGDRAFFIFYGTRDARRTQVFGPFISDRREAPREERISWTTELPPGERRRAGERHDGLRATWYRMVQAGTGSSVERTSSVYEARPVTWQVGIDSASRTDVDESGMPSWLPSSF